MINPLDISHEVVLAPLIRFPRLGPLEDEQVFVGNPVNDVALNARNRRADVICVRGKSAGSEEMNSTTVCRPPHKFFERLSNRSPVLGDAQQRLQNTEASGRRS